MKTTSCYILMLGLLLISLAPLGQAQSDLEISTGVDWYNRYVWRGLDIAGTPSIQPTLSLEYSGFEIGIWGAYTLSNETSESDEIDFWLGYTHDLGNDASLGLVVTDYYFPNAGVAFFNFNNYDKVIDDSIPDPGAHTVEVGVSVTGPKSFPMTVSGFVNVHNDAGNNTYFQAEYPFGINGTDFNFFVGVTGGSKDNPDYYGADSFEFINIGISAERKIAITDSFVLPLSISFLVNPNVEISYLLVGVSL